MPYKISKVPAGDKISIASGKLQVPDRPIVPFIEGDGTGADIWRASVRVLDASVQKIAIANPQHAPYGRAAVAALKHAGMYDRVADRLVLGENVSQAAQFVESGNAQAGFVALAHAVAPAMHGKGKYWEVPADTYPPLAQGVVLLSRSQHRKEAAQFLEYIKTKEAAELFRKYGFKLQ